MITKYKRQATEDEIRDDHELDQEAEPVEKVEQKVEVIQDKKEVSNEEETFKKRYGDLRRYQQEKENEFKRKIKELEERLLNTNNEPLPTTEEELQEWVNKYPVVANMVKALARKEAEKLDTKYADKVSRVEELEKEAIIKREMNKLMRLQPDFYGDNGILASPEFADWVENHAKPWAREALTTVEDVDAEKASDAIELFKVQTSWGKKKVNESENKMQTAASVQSPRNTKPAQTVRKYKFSESQVEKMSQREYDAKEEEILEAMRTGQFEYDLSVAS